jgi:hypothetical protein
MKEVQAMVTRALPDKLMDICEIHAPEIAGLWYKAIINNERTMSCRDLSEDILVRQASEYLQNLKKMYFAEDPFAAAKHSLEATQYAKYAYENKIPLQEAIYALIIMRRQLWLYAESQAIFFDNAIEIYQVLGSVNRTILLFDYAIYLVTQYYSQAAK